MATYRVCFAVLGIPALLTVMALVLSKIKYPHPEGFETAEEGPRAFHFEPSFIFYMIAICLFAFGFADFTLITLHVSRTALLPPETFSLLYAAAMIMDAVAALFSMASAIILPMASSPAEIVPTFAMASMVSTSLAFA